MMVRIVYNPCCFYWAVLDEHGAEIGWGATREDAEAWVHAHIG